MRKRKLESDPSFQQNQTSTCLENKDTSNPSIAHSEVTALRVRPVTVAPLLRCAAAVIRHGIFPFLKLCDAVTLASASKQCGELVRANWLRVGFDTRASAPCRLPVRCAHFAAFVASLRALKQLSFVVEHGSACDDVLRRICGDAEPARCGGSAAAAGHSVCWTDSCASARRECGLMLPMSLESLRVSTCSSLPLLLMLNRMPLLRSLRATMSFGSQQVFPFFIGLARECPLLRELVLVCSSAKRSASPRHNAATESVVDATSTHIATLAPTSASPAPKAFESLESLEWCGSGSEFELESTAGTEFHVLLEWCFASMPTLKRLTLGRLNCDIARALTSSRSVVQLESLVVGILDLDADSNGLELAAKLSARLSVTLTHMSLMSSDNETRRPDTDSKLMCELLGACTALREFECCFVGEIMLLELVRAHPSLRTLCLGWHHPMRADACFPVIAQHCRELEQLTLWGELTDIVAHPPSSPADALSSVMQLAHCSRLQYCAFEDNRVCAFVDAEAISGFISSLPELRVLAISHTGFDLKLKDLHVICGAAALPMETLILPMPDGGIDGKSTIDNVTVTPLSADSQCQWRCSPLSARDYTYSCYFFNPSCVLSRCTAGRHHGLDAPVPAKAAADPEWVRCLTRS